MSEEVKKCSKCGETKYLDKFHKNRTKPDGRSNWCAECAKKNTTRWRTKRLEVDADYVRDIRLSRKYGINTQQYNKMYAEQSGRCWICRRTPEEAGHKGHYEGLLYIDHSHRTGDIRKLLCQGCNPGIGLFGEDIQRMERAIEYLKEFAS